MGPQRRNGKKYVAYCSDILKTMVFEQALYFVLYGERNFFVSEPEL